MICLYLVHVWYMMCIPDNPAPQPGSRVLQTHVFEHQTQRALLHCRHSRPGARLPKSQPACSLYALGSLALQLSQPFCTLLLGFIGLALSRPGYYPLRRVHWHPASPSAYLARVLRSQPEPARIIFSASGTRCKPYTCPLAFKWVHRLTHEPAR